MTIFSRYVFGQAFSALLLVLVSLTGIVWIALALRQLNIMTSSGQSAFTLLKVTTLGLPNFIAVIAPFALLISVIHVLNRLSNDSEIISLTASGAPAWTLTRPVIVLGIIVSIMVTIVNHVVLPASIQTMRATILQIRTDVLTQVIQPGKFSSPEPGLVFHIRERTTQGELRDLLMQDTRESKNRRSYLSERAVIVKQDESAFMIMHNGHILTSDGAREPHQIIEFDRYIVDLDQFEKKKAGPIARKPRELYTHELFQPNPENQIYKAHPGRFSAELHERFASPLYPIAFALLAVAMVGQVHSTRQSGSAHLGICFAVGAACRLGGMGANNVAVGQPHLAFILYLIPLGVMAVAIFLILKGNSQQGGRSASLSSGPLSRLLAAGKNALRLPSRISGRST